MRTVIFDLDGTLADTGADLITAANLSLTRGGFQVALDPVADKSTAFHGGRAMLTLALTRLKGEVQASDIEPLYLDFLKIYGDVLDNETRFYPGALEAVETLRSAGFATGICTNKPEGLAETLMTRLGGRGLFDTLIGADTLPVRKPDPAPYVAAVEGAGGIVKHSLLVGDTVTDRKTAIAAGVPCILVTFGPDGTDVADLKPEGLLPDFAALPALVEDLLPLPGA